MIREKVVSSLCELAASFGELANGTEWHIFGSVERDDYAAKDIDLMIFCVSDKQADTLRALIDPDSLLLPIHLALFTFDEAKAINATQMQQSKIIFPSLKNCSGR